MGLSVEGGGLYDVQKSLLPILSLLYLSISKVQVGYYSCVSISEVLL